MAEIYNNYKQLPNDFLDRVEDAREEDVTQTARIHYDECGNPIAACLYIGEELLHPILNGAGCPERLIVQPRMGGLDVEPIGEDESTDSDE